MVVIKIGGSLQSTSYIKKWIKEIKINRNESFLLVFGGGKYAKYVRNEQKIKNYNDEEAHKLAIDAMKKFTYENISYLKDFTFIDSFSYLKKNFQKRKLYVWLPSEYEVEQLNIPKNWDATSDSIALEISKKVNAPLLLIKSIRFNKEKYINPFILKKSVLDNYFSNNYKNYHNRISIVGREKHYKLKEICNYLLN